MLYDPKWEQKTKADPLTLPALIAWLGKQTPDERYCYSDIGHCLLARYLIALGYKGVDVGGSRVSCDNTLLPLPREINWVAARVPHTFGAALERARELAAQSKGL